MKRKSGLKIYLDPNNTRERKTGVRKERRAAEQLGLGKEREIWKTGERVGGYNGIHSL